MTAPFVAGGVLAAGLVVGAAIGGLSAVWWAPRRVMHRAYRRWAPANTWVHGPVDAGRTASWVPLGNPDVLPSRAAFDLRAGPLLLSGPVPPSTYWSLTGYDHRSVHFLLLTHRDVPDCFALALVRRGDEAGRARAAALGLAVHESPGRRGYLLQRTFVDATSDLAGIDALRERCAVTPL